MRGNDKLIVALDVDTFSRAEELVDALSPEVEIFKVGITPFTKFGGEILKKIENSGKKVFLDLKFHDIPNTVAGAAKAGALKNVFMMNFHCLGGRRMMEAARDAVNEIDSRIRPILLGVTILTSMSEEEMNSTGLNGTIENKVIELARLAASSGLDGVVASAKEASAIKKEIGENFIVVTPGVRPEWSEKGDQKRVLTPKQAIQAGADYIVVGRPIIQEKDPLRAAKKIIEEISKTTSRE